MTLGEHISPPSSCRAQPTGPLQQQVFSHRLAALGETPTMAADPTAFHPQIQNSNME